MQFAVDTASPVNNQHDFRGRIVHINSYYVNEPANDALAQTGNRIGPERLELSF